MTKKMKQYVGLVTQAQHNNKKTTDEDLQVCMYILIYTTVQYCLVVCSAHDNVRSSDNFRLIYARDRPCAIMSGQNVRAQAADARGSYESSNV